MLDPALRQRMLVEMGYRPLRWRGRAPAPVATPEASAPTNRSGAAAVPGGQVDPIWRSLLRAVGAEHMDLQSLGWEERLDGPAFDFDGPTLRINPIALRRQPQAKRALWRTLRALRRRLAQNPARQG